MAHRIYLPITSISLPPSIFGFEAAPSALNDPLISSQASELGAKWLRLNGVEWSKVEPIRGASYNWSALATFDSALARAKQLGLTPVVIVRGHPLWATVNGTSQCAAVRDEAMPDFARFLGALATRYKDQVQYWEIGNEPDVDPSLVGPTSPFGCWGNIADPYYGGERYGRALLEIAPRMRAANPQVKIVIGGLLLDRPVSTDPRSGKPEKFFEGVLRAGAGAAFDIVAFHSYPSYSSPNYDHDLLSGDTWSRLGGWTVGKATYLRTVMTRYNISKPLWLNETSLICSPGYASCSPPSAAFFKAQADHLVRVMTRSAAAGISQVVWYMLEGPGWRSSSLLDGQQQPRPSYKTYQLLLTKLSTYLSVAPFNGYGPGVEAYRFSRGSTAVDVVWSRSSTVHELAIPRKAFLAAVQSDGFTPPLEPGATTIRLNVGFTAVLIERTP